eukprot:1178145-Prorocentrum_minimum.AAC.2
MTRCGFLALLVLQQLLLPFDVLTMQRLAPQVEGLKCGGLGDQRLIRNLRDAQAFWDRPGLEHVHGFWLGLGIRIDQRPTQVERLRHSDALGSGKGRLLHPLLFSAGARHPFNNPTDLGLSCPSMPWNPRTCA